MSVPRRKRARIPSVLPVPALRSSPSYLAGRKPPFYALLLAPGAILSVVIVLSWPCCACRDKGVRRNDDAGVTTPTRAAQPEDRRGFYQEGSFAGGGFIPYSHIGGLTWREGEQVTLVSCTRMRAFAREGGRPERHYGAARRLLRDKIAEHDISSRRSRLISGCTMSSDDV